MEAQLPLDQRRFFRDQLREARAAALLDGEGFHSIVSSLERLGSMLNPAGKSLGQFQSQLLMVARKATSAPVDGDDRGTYTPLDALFAAVREGRNDAVHQGAYARHLVRHCVELALFVEEGLMAGANRVVDYMVRTPACAEAWQPIALARQQMLTNSFSYLPIWFEDRWHLLSDHAVASYLADSSNPREAVRQRIGAACERGELLLERAVAVDTSVEVREALKVCGGRPVLVVDDHRLLGIVTPFDLLEGERPPWVSPALVLIKAAVSIRSADDGFGGSREAVHSHLLLIRQIVPRREPDVPAFHNWIG
jgi:hypothetical protein